MAASRAAASHRPRPERRRRAPAERDLAALDPLLSRARKPLAARRPRRAPRRGCGGDPRAVRRAWRARHGHLQGEGRGARRPSLVRRRLHERVGRAAAHRRERSPDRRRARSGRADPAAVDGRGADRRTAGRTMSTTATCRSPRGWSRTCRRRWRISPSASRARRGTRPACGRTSQRQRAAIAVPAPGLTAQRVVEIAASQLAPAFRVTVDAGAHMFPATVLWPADDPNGLLISNGLSTMGFALPAAIGAALAERGRRVVVLTGDGGLLMCGGGTADGRARAAADSRDRLQRRVAQPDRDQAAAAPLSARPAWRSATWTGPRSPGSVGVPAWRADDEAGLEKAIAKATATWRDRRSSTRASTDRTTGRRCAPCAGRTHVVSGVSRTCPIVVAPASVRRATTATTTGQV